MPGIETGAPDLTETRRGLVVPPNFLSVSFSTLPMADFTRLQELEPFDDRGTALTAADAESRQADFLVLAFQGMQQCN